MRKCTGPEGCTGAAYCYKGEQGCSLWDDVLAAMPVCEVQQSCSACTQANIICLWSREENSCSANEGILADVLGKVGNANDCLLFEKCDKQETCNACLRAGCYGWSPEASGCHARALWGIGNPPGFVTANDECPESGEWLIASGVCPSGKVACARVYIHCTWLYFLGDSMEQVLWSWVPFANSVLQRRVSNDRAY